jgi:hypothetical protein
MPDLMKAINDKQVFGIRGSQNGEEEFVEGRSDPQDSRTCPFDR